MAELTDEQLVEALRGSSDDQLVGWFLNFREFLEKEAEAQAKHVAPHIKKQTMVQNELHARLLQRNPNWQPGMKASGSAGGGTFFLKTSTSTKVADRQAFFDYVIENNATNLLTAHVAKEGIEEYQKEHNDALPPGVTIDRFAQLQVRKT